MLVGGARANPSPPPAEAAEEKEVGQPPPGSELPAAPPITSPNAVLEKARPHDSRPHSPAHTTAAGSELVSSSSNNRRFSTLSGDSVSDPDTSWVSEDLGPPCVVCHSNSASDLLLKCELCDVAIHTFCSSTPSIYSPPGQYWRCAKCFDPAVPGRMKLPRIRKYRKKRSSVASTSRPVAYVPTQMLFKQ
eukprot:TRINITY_DN5915_c0_g1_i2.p1 TRINITY_DN5915_c0_g1~~TRINITY_DN5915_c0_g1_i2.p1  ORF type:complete len:190 (+),score=13.19 TRINITY_DN5915_c0_g1_i2:71-640(+)